MYFVYDSYNNNIIIIINNIFWMRLMFYSDSDTLSETILDNTGDAMQVISFVFCAYCGSQVD